MQGSLEAHVNGNGERRRAFLLGQTAPEEVAQKQSIERGSSGLHHHLLSHPIPGILPRRPKMCVFPISMPERARWLWLHDAGGGLSSRGSSPSTAGQGELPSLTPASAHLARLKPCSMQGDKQIPLWGGDELVFRAGGQIPASFLIAAPVLQGSSGRERGPWVTRQEEPLVSLGAKPSRPPLAHLRKRTSVIRA